LERRSSAAAQRALQGGNQCFVVFIDLFSSNAFLVSVILIMRSTVASWHLARIPSAVEGDYRMLLKPDLLRARLHSPRLQTTLFEMETLAGFKFNAKVC
jgi:hypothetical protein